MLQIIFYLFYVFCLAIFICYFFLLPDPPPVSGVYSQPGKYFFLKYSLFRLLYWLRQQQQKRKQAGGHGVSGAGYGVKSKADIAEMETLQKLPTSAPLAVDAVYFNASDQEGGYFVAASARRQNHVSQTVLMIRVPTLGLLELPSIPDTHLKRTDEDLHDHYGAAGLKIKPIEPMKRWRIWYQGKLRLNRDKDQIFDAELSLEWTACTDYFDFDTDMNAHALATSIAREPWSRELFERLRDAHQTHYEQFGDIKGTLKLVGIKDPEGSVDISDSKRSKDELEIQLNMRGARDHSYGNVRDWAHFHRYAMQFVHTSDGTCFNAAVVSMPRVTMSRLEFGYLFKKDGRKLALRSINFPLADFGETTEAPWAYEFEFEDEEMTKYKVECEVLARPEFYLGQDGKRETLILEQMCRYKVNGNSGWGFSEWQYRHLDYREKKEEKE